MSFPHRNPVCRFAQILSLLLLAAMTWPRVAPAAQLSLSWTDNSTNENGFKIERKTGTSGTFAQIATVGANLTSYTNTGLATATTYCYRVRAYNTAGNSAYSSEACGTAAAFGFSLTNGGSKSVTQGFSISNTISATLVWGISQSVSFSAAGLPLGTTKSFSPTACSPTCSTSLTISTTTSTPTGFYTITVTGSGGGVTKTTSFTLTVNPAASSFNFSLSNGGSKSVTQGASVSNTISAALVSGTAQSVSFSVSGLPSGATKSFSPTACSPTCSTTLTLTAPTTTPIGIYTITVTGTGGGVTKTTSFSLTVTAPGSTTTTRSFQDGVFPSSLYSGTRDTRIVRSAPGTSYGQATTLWVDGDGGSPALLRWKDLTIPAGSIVKSATITLNVTNPTSGTYNLYAAKRDWWEDQSNWNRYGPGYNWQIPGAKGTSDRGTTVLGTVTAASTGKRTITLNAAGIALVQSWVNFPNQNNGIIVDKPTVTDDMAFDSRNASTASNRPKLTVTYVAP